MRFRRYIGSAIALGVALTVSAASNAAAQTDSTRARSTRRIPVQKDRNFSYTGQTSRRESTGEVMLTADRARLDSLAMAAASDRQRVDSLVTLSAATAAKTDELVSSLAAVADSLRTVRGEVSSVRGELTTVATRANVLADSVRYLDQRLMRLQNGSIFGNSGFYAGVGTGANVTVGTLRDIGYREGLNIIVPVGYHKQGSALGVRGEFGLQTFDGRVFSGVANPDPKILSAVGMLTAHLPLNAGKTHNFYLMGGGGAYMFRDIGATSSLSGRLGESNSNQNETTNATKWGVTGGAGLDLHLIGAAHFFVQSRVTNVFGDEPTQAGNGTGKNLLWVPISAGFTFK